MLYIDEDQNLQTIVANSSSNSSDITAAADTYIAATETLVDSLNLYGRFMTEYGNRLTPATALKISKNQETTPPNPLLATQFGTAVTDCNAAISDCGVETDLQLCLHEALNTKCPANAVQIGASAVFAVGNPTITGLAMESAPLTLTTSGATIPEGAIVGVFFNYCASSGGTCAIASKQVSLSASGSAVTSLPVGDPGTLSIHIPGCAPIVSSEVTVGSDGLSVGATCAPTDTATIEDVTAAVDASSESAGAADPGTGTCDTIEEILVNPAPTTPAPLEDVLVTVSVFPKAGGCTVSFSVAGSDDYTLSGDLSTDADGVATFSIDGADEGVIDNVSITANGLTTLITYGF